MKMEEIALLVLNYNKFRRKSVILPHIKGSYRNLQMLFEIVSLLFVGF